MAPRLRDELDWDLPLHFRRGGRVRLAGLPVYFDFTWLDLMHDRRMQFQNGQCLARRVREDCPEGKIPALLLTGRTDVEEGARITASFYVVVLKLPRYLEQAEADAAVSYLANALGPITQVHKLQELAAADPSDLRNLIQLNLEIDDIATWVRGNATRLAELRTITDKEGAVASNVTTAVEALQSLKDLDAEVIGAVAALVGTDRQRRLDLLRAITDDSTGRYVAAEVLGERVEERLADARAAASAYTELVKDETSKETDLQRFLEANPWLLGLDYSRVLPRQAILRGTLDFLLARFDGLYDLLELKSPNDPIVLAPADTSGPPSASRFALSPSLAQALAQVHVYRDALRNNEVSEEWFGLPHTRDPKIIIVIGKTTKLTDVGRRVLREFNRSLHRVEIVPYDILGQRAGAILDNVERYLIAADATDSDEASKP
jgi:hypothetical protein